MGTNAPTVVEELQQQSETFRRNAQELQQLAFGMGQNAAQKAALEESAASNIGGRPETPESFLVRQQEDLLAQQERRKFMGAMDYSALSYDIARETAKTTREQITIANKIQTDSAVSLFDDPGLAIVNAFTLPWDQQALEGATQKLEALNTAKAKLDTTFQQHAQSTELAKQSLTDASILSVSKGLAALQQMRVIDATNAALASDAQGIERVMNASAKATDAQIKILQVQDSQEARKFRKEQFAVLQEGRQDRLNILKEKEEARKASVHYVNLARAREGLPALAPETVLNALTMPKGSKVQEQMLNWYDRGIMRASGMEMSDGETLQEAQAYWVSTGVRAANPRQENIMAAVTNAVAAAKGTKDKTAAAKEAGDKFDATFKNWTGNIVPGDTSNPFQPPSYAAMESMPSLKAHKAFPVVATLLTDANKNNPMDQQQIFDTLVAAVLKRDITGNDATSFITELYKKNTALVNEQANPGKLVGKTMTTWNATIKHSPVMGEPNAGMARLIPTFGKAINLNDPVLIQQEVAMSIARRLGAQINWSGEYPENWKGGMYPPTFKSGVLMPQ